VSLLAAKYWWVMSMSTRLMFVFWLFFLPALLFRAIFQHARMQDRLAGLESDAKCKELLKQAARLTSDNLLQPFLVLVMIVTLLAEVMRSYQAAIATCQSTLR
jgi:hypothetical protein